MSESGQPVPAADAAEIEETITRLGIEEVVHFTTNRGVLGMFASGAILPRSQLPKEKYLEHVYKPNAAERKDPNWTGCNSLSITRVNTDFFGVSRYWHAHTEVWWAVVSIDPVVLTHAGVVFVTTNNIYPSRIRGTGAPGLEAIFADPVLGKFGHEHRRTPELPENCTTDVQAEVLYPGRISTEFIRRVYVLTDQHADIVSSQYDILAQSDDPVDVRPELPIEVRPEFFE